MNVSLTEKQQQYIDAQLQSGDFKNASEVICDAIHLHQIYRNKVIANLRLKIENGWSGPASRRSASQIARDKRAQHNQ